MKRLVAAFLLAGLLGIFALPYFRPSLIQINGYNAPFEPDEWSKEQSTRVQQITFTHCPPFTVLGEINLCSDETCAPASLSDTMLPSSVQIRIKTGRDPPRTSFNHA